MNTIFRNTLAVVVGLIIGSMVNMAIIMISSSVIAPPEGADVTTAEGLKASMHLFQPKHFIMPFLAHALGTFIGCLLAALIAVTHKMRFVYTISIFFLLGGIANVVMLPSPIWFSILDILGAYLPMAFMAGKLVGDKTK